MLLMNILKQSQVQILRYDYWPDAFEITYAEWEISKLRKISIPQGMLHLHQKVGVKHLSHN